MSAALLKTPAQLKELVTKRLRADWQSAIVSGEGWPHRMALGKLDAAAAAADPSAYARCVRDLVHTARAWGCPDLETLGRRIAGTIQDTPTHLIVPDVDTAARIVGAPWPTVLADGRRHAQILALDDRDPTLAETIVRSTRGWSDADVTILRDAAAWFAANGPGTGLTPRQVPVAGMHAKWLDGRRTVVANLAGIDHLELIDRPSTIALTYVDPDYLTTGMRVHDTITGDDPHTPPYPIDVALICENKDSAVYFHPHPRTVVIQGQGDAVDRIERIPWMHEVPLVIYWGDIDQRGLHLLARARAALQRPDRPVRSMLMDLPTRDAYELYGTRTHADGKPILWADTKPPTHLEPHELSVYELLGNPTYTGNLRYEQERIPLHVAAQALRALTDRESGSIAVTV